MLCKTFVLKNDKIEHMSSQSIDGLRRRGDKVVVRRQSVGTKPTSQPRKISVASTKKRSLEAPDKKKELKNLIEHESAVRDFLEEVKDVDPTNLADVPKKEKKAKKHKKMKDKKPAILY